MSTSARLAWIAGCAALLLAGPAAGQSSLGGQQNLAPPAPSAPAAPASPAAPARPGTGTTQQRPAATAATPPRAPQPAAGTPRPGTGTQATPPRPTTGTQAAQPRPATGTQAAQPRPATGTQASQPRPATGTAQQRPAGGQAATQQQRRRAAGAAAAGAAAGAAATAARPAQPAPPPEPPTPPTPRVGSATNLPLPRYASLGSNQVNLRVGPDLRYPIEWTYQRKDLPVQIIDEHQLWRRIRDPEGTEGWVQRPLLTSRRSFLIPAGGDRVLRRRAEEGAAEVARLRPGVVGRIRKCEAGNAWCEVQVGDYRGYIRRAEIWGVTADEAVN